MATHLGSLALLVTTLTACSSSSGDSDANSDPGRLGSAGGSVSLSGTKASGAASAFTAGTDSRGSATAGRSAIASGGNSNPRATAPVTGGSNSSGVHASTSGRVTSENGGSSELAGKPNTGGVASSIGGSSGLGGVSTAVSSDAAFDCRREGDGKTTLVFVNGCTKPVSYRGSDISGGTLAPGAFACVDVGTATETISSKRYWGWTQADPGSGRHTLAEFTFNTDFHDLDWYNISHVDAHNLPMAILPSARPKCRGLICPQDFLTSCPAAGQYRDQAGDLASCVSPDRDDPNNEVVKLFEQCDDAYAWSGDDQNGTDTSPMIGCEVEDFDIVFCPEAT